MVNPSGKSLATSTGPIWSTEDKAKFSKVIQITCSLQRQFGKTAHDLKTLVDGFSYFLAEYPVGIVIIAIKAYVANHPDIPTPSDIRAIIDPHKPEWKPEWPYYKSLKDRRDAGGEYAISEEEMDYIKACEEWSLGALKRSRY